MKKILTLLIAICTMTAAQGQVFFSTDCGTLVNVTQNCPATYDAEIIVSGLPPLGANNFGLIENFFDIFIVGGFPAQVTLTAPNGSSYDLTRELDGPGSFPNAFNGNYRLTFRSCFNFPFHDEDIGQSPNDLTFNPAQDFTGINDQGIDPNGTWLMSFCGVPDDFQVGCARLTFGTVCPIVTDVQILNPPTCDGNTDGEIQIVATPGACMSYYYINGNNYDLNETGIFSNIGTGSLSATVTDPNSLFSRSVAFCVNTLDVDIASGDDEAPIFTNCPTDFVAFVDDQCNFNITITDPLIADNCGSFTATMDIIYPDGSTDIFGVQPGGTFGYPGSGTGTIFVTYTATDGVNESTCSFEVSIQDSDIPMWINQSVTVTGTCGVDDPIVLRNSVVNQLAAGDNCDANPVIAATGNDQVSNTCGSANTHTYEYEVFDNSGNVNPTFGTVTVILTDNTAPILSGVPADVTIGCNDAFPTMPSVTAMDNCAGDITDQIVITDSFVDGSCDLNANSAIITYTWTVDDGCGNGIAVNWNITVFNDEAVDLGDDISACVGEAVTLTAGGLTGDYLWSTGETTSSITVTTANTYTVEVIGNSGCCSEDEIIVSFGDIPTATATGGTLDCAGGDITLMGNSSLPNVTYAWSGPGGYTSSEQNPSVNQVGTYTLVVTTAAGCDDSADAMVDANTDVPDISTQGDVIDCNNTVATISGSSSTPGVTYSWVGPNGYTSSDPVNTVTDPGDYFLTVTAANNCIAEGIAVVELDSDVPTIQVDDDEINCNNSSVILEANPSSTNVSFDWSGPNGFTSDLANPEVFESGTYICVVTSVNGCSDTDEGIVTEDVAVPEIIAAGGTITCIDNIVQLNVSSSTTGITYQWSGPNGYSSNEQNPTVDIEGDYTITIEAPNGCTNQAMVQVNADISTPDLMAQGGDIGCDGEPTMINASSTVDGVTYSWTGPDNFTSNQANPTVGTAGEYTIILTAPNGCINTTMVTVTADASTPVASLSVGTVDCDNNNRILSVTASDPNYTYAWTKDNADIGTTQEITVSEAGSYKVVVSSAACAVTLEYIQEENIQALQTSIQATEATSSALGTASIDILNSMLGVTIVWDNGQTGTDATDLSVGEHTVTVTNAFGCVYVYEFEILLNTSVKELEDVINWEVFPTLTNDYVNLKADFSTAKVINIKIISLNGQLLLNENLGKVNSINKSLDITNFATGVYMITVQSEREIKTVKIVKI